MMEKKALTYIPVKRMMPTNTMMKFTTKFRERSPKEHMNMDPDSSEDPFANSAAGGGDEFMAVKPCTGTIQHIHKKIKQISGANGSRKNKSSGSGSTSKACDHHGMPVNEIDFERRI